MYEKLVSHFHICVFIIVIISFEFTNTLWFFIVHLVLIYIVVKLNISKMLQYAKKPKKRAKQLPIFTLF